MQFSNYHLLIVRKCPVHFRNPLWWSSQIGPTPTATVGIQVPINDALYLGSQWSVQFSHAYNIFIIQCSCVWGSRVFMATNYYSWESKHWLLLGMPKEASTGLWPNLEDVHKVKSSPVAIWWILNSDNVVGNDFWRCVNVVKRKLVGIMWFLDAQGSLSLLCTVVLLQCF